MVSLPHNVNTNQPHAKSFHERPSPVLRGELYQVQVPGVEVFFHQATVPNSSVSLKGHRQKFYKLQFRRQSLVNREGKWIPVGIGIFHCLPSRISTTRHRALRVPSLQVIISVYLCMCVFVCGIVAPRKLIESVLSCNSRKCVQLKKNHQLFSSC